MPATVTPTEPVLVHSSEFAEVWRGRAEEVLPRYSKESMGLVVTDPPYGVEWNSGYRSESFGQLHGDGSGESDRGTIRQIISECVRLVGQDRHLYVFGPPDTLEGQKISAVTQLIWDKGTIGTGDLTSAWGPGHELINFCVSRHRHAGRAGKDGLPVRLRKGSVLRFNRPTGRKVRHPSEKLVPLLRELIESSSRQGETVLDPFAGTGGTGVAAILLGRKTLLVESDARWIDIAVERVQAAEEVAREAAAL